MKGFMELYLEFMIVLLEGKKKTHRGYHFELV